MDAHYSPMSRMVVLKVKGLALAGCKKVCWGKRQRQTLRGVTVYLSWISNVQKCSDTHTTHAVLHLKALTKVKCDGAFSHSFPSPLLYHDKSSVVDPWMNEWNGWIHACPQPKCCYQTH